MFSVIFPGQGSQSIGMGKEFFEKYSLVKNLFKEADESLGISLSKIILEYLSVSNFISLGDVSCLAIIVCSYKFIYVI